MQYETKQMLKPIFKTVLVIYRKRTMNGNGHLPCMFLW